MEMQRLTLSLLALLALLVSCQKQKDAKAMQTTFETYKTAVKNHDDSISHYLDKESIRVLTEFERIAKQGTIEEHTDFISKSDAPLTWKYLFYFVGKIGPHAYDSLQYNPDLSISLFSLAQVPIFSATMIDNFSWGEIVKQNEYISTVKLVVADHFIDMNTRKKVNINKEFTFREEMGSWKFNVVSYFNLFDRFLEYAAAEKGMSPEHYVQSLFNSEKQ